MLIFALACAVAVVVNPLDDLRTHLALDEKSRPTLAVQAFASASLSAQEATDAARLLWEDWAARAKKERETQWKAGKLTVDGKELKFRRRSFAAQKKPRALYISLHGGGNTPTAVNDQQWRNQVDLYTPPDGLYIAPRAPTDTWNLWHEPHMDGLIDRLIQDAIVFEDVDPNRVYLLGYSAGGDGVYQLAPRMADRFAAAAMMAGHPNDADPRSLRNLPFAIHVGEKDDAYSRNSLAKEWGVKLDALRKTDPEGYDHVAKVHAGKGHWMDREDAEAIAWLAARVRPSAPPKRVVWAQDDVTHGRAYWLSMPRAEQRLGIRAAARTVGVHEVRIEADTTADTLTILLRDDLLDLSAPITVLWESPAPNSNQPGPAPVGQTITVERTIRALAESLSERPDPVFLYPARMTVGRPKK